MPPGDRSTARWIVKPGVIGSGSSYAFRTLASIFLAVVLLLNSTIVTFAEDINVRVLAQDVILQVNHWQLLNWKDSRPVCNVYIQGEKPPGSVDIINSCGFGVFQTWMTTPVCLQALDGYGASCPGLFQRYVGKTTITIKNELRLPTITFDIRPITCTAGRWCSETPRLRITAVEPVVGYEISKLYLLVGGLKEIYDGADGEFNLPLTSESGGWIEFWADSSLGDQSEHVRLKYRNFQPDLQVQNYRFDLIGDKWPDSAGLSSLLWNIFPPATGILSKVFQQPNSVEELHTVSNFAYLAGKLIQTGSASAKGCVDSGLLTNGWANPCGLLAANKNLVEWQNKYDGDILAAAVKYNVPARVIKGIIAQETQFWPLSDNPYELGLGKITDNGVDMLLMWNLDYYLAVCTPVYGQTACSAGYSNFPPERQSILRWTILNKTEPKKQIDTVAATLYASAAQTNQMLINTVPTEPDNAVTYEDMWKITIANYHAGSGCVSVGMQSIATNGLAFNWNNLVNEMMGNCRDAKKYVDKVIDLFE